MTTSTTDLAPAAKVALLKHLSAGKGLDVVATITKLSREQVLDVASHHGYPDKDKLAWAVDVLEKKLDAEAAVPDRTEEANRQASSERRVALAEAPTPAPAALTRPDEIRVLLNTAKGHESKRIQNAANKVLDDLDKLRTLIREDQEKHAARRAAAAEKAAARAEVERLEAQLAEAKAKLRGGTGPKSKTTTTISDGPSAAEVRAWAAKNDVECPAVGRVPAAVRAAYDEAHLEKAS